MAATRDETLQLRHQRLRLEAILFGRAEAVVVGRYELGQWLGAGGMGTVYAAHDPSLDRTVAIKVLRRHLSEDARASARLVREAKAMARIAHPHVLTVHEVGIEHGQPYVVMARMPGGTLVDWQHRHPRGEPGREAIALRLLRECTDGLAAAHDAGLVHRDFKPLNVLLDDQDRAKVADFGLVRWRTESTTLDAHSGDAFADLDEGDTLTRDGGTPGTPQYMAPEQHTGLADARSDQYALCKTFLEILGDPSKPAAVVAILCRGASEDPGDRFDDLHALRRALDRAAPTRRAGRWYLGGAAGLVAASALGVAMLRPSELPSSTIVPCTDGRDALEPAWGVARRDAIRVAFEASGTPVWRNAWDGVHTRFDDYVSRWAAARLDACEATQIRRVQDDRMMQMRLACLDQRRQTLQTYSDAYASGDVDVVEDALSTSAALPDIAACSAREALAVGAEGRGLDDPQVRAAFDALGHADALRALGRYAQADAVYPEAIAQLEAIGAHALLSAAYHARASMVLEAGDYDESESLAREALRHAEIADNDVSAARAWLKMSMVARLRGRSDDATLFLERAENVATRHPDAAGLQAEVARGRGSHERKFGKPAAALAALERARLLCDEAGGSDIARLEIQHEMLAVLSRLGRDDEARDLGETLVRQARDTWGEAHPLTSMVSTAHAQYFLRREDWQVAASLLRVGAQRPMRTHRADLVADMRMGYATAVAGLGRVDEATTMLDSVIGEATPILGEHHSSVIAARMQIASVLIDAAEPAAALARLEAIEPWVGRQIEAASGSPMHPLNRCAYWNNLALAQVGVGRDAARDSADLALAICRAAAAPDSVWLFTALRYVGEVYARTGAKAEARACFREAIAIAQKVSVSPKELAYVRDAFDDD